MGNNLTVGGRRERHWPNQLWKWEESIKLKAEVTVHGSSCAVVDAVLSQGVQVNSETTVHVYGTEQLSKWWWVVRARFPSVGEGGCRHIDSIGRYHMTHV